MKMQKVLIRQRFDIKKKKITKNEDKQFSHDKIWQKKQKGQKPVVTDITAVIFLFRSFF